MRFRTRIVNFLRSTPLGGSTDWALLHIAPGARERRRHHAIDVETFSFIESHLRDGGAAIDVGAHTGAILSEIVRISPAGNHHAVEPLPDLAASLRRLFPMVNVHECILGSAEFVTETDGMSVIHRNVDDPGYSSVVRQSHPRLKDVKVEPVRVKVRTLDEIASECVDLRLVKIDVEGFELEVLTGAQAMLRDHRPAIVFEHERVEEKSGSTSDLHDLFDGSQYRITRLVDWRSPAWLSSAEFEASNRNGDSYYLAIPT